MKVYLITCFLIFTASIPSFSQVDIERNENGLYEYRRNLSVEGKSKDEIFRLANIWLARTYVDSRAVVKYSDKESGTIIGTGVFDYKMLGVSMTAQYSILIETKDEKLRISYSDFRLIWGDQSDSIAFEDDKSGYRAQVKRAITQANVDFDRAFFRLQKFMSNPRLGDF